MTQQVVRARVTLQSTDPDTDAASMDFIVEATGSNPNLDFTTSITPQAWIEQLFNVAVGAHPIAYYISPYVNRAANTASITWTDITAHLDGSPAGGPFRTDQWTLGTGGGTAGLPGQLAACFAMRADYGSTIEHGPMASLPSTDDAIDQGAPPTHMGQTRPRGRMRGRVYIGPLQTNALNSSIPGTWDPTFTASVSSSMNFFMGTQNTGGPNQFNLVNWSRRNAAVNTYKFYYLNEGVATVRRRTDTTQARTHAWVPV